MKDTNEKNTQDLEKLKGEVLIDLIMEDDMNIFNECVEALKEKKTPKIFISLFENQFNDYLGFLRTTKYDDIKKLYGHNLFVQFKEMYLNSIKDSCPFTEESMEVLRKRFNEKLEKKINGMDYC